MQKIKNFFRKFWKIILIVGSSIAVVLIIVIPIGATFTVGRYGTVVFGYGSAESYRRETYTGYIADGGKTIFVPQFMEQNAIDSTTKSLTVHYTVITLTRNASIISIAKSEFYVISGYSVYAIAASQLFSRNGNTTNLSVNGEVDPSNWGSITTS
ncbi:MAG: hypothetical protein LBR37_03875 [Erysipelotrichaceae bacterium]|jgi:hypothetical protein|nr:hypothetical protein [Erysipelotrichaceae bacterium]